MPELPEVETVKRGLSELIVGKRVVSVRFDWPGSSPGEYMHYCGASDSAQILTFSQRCILDTSSQNKVQSGTAQKHLVKAQFPQVYSKSFPNAQTDVDSFLLGAVITDIKRRGKALVISLDSNYVLAIHLKMTGQLVFVNKETTGSSESVAGEERWGAGHPTDSLIGKLPDKSTRVTLTFDDDSKLFFNDQRKFGWMRLLPKQELQNLPFIKKLGPEPLQKSFTSKKFIQRLGRRNNSGIKAVLLDQSVLAGVGNIYADESLFAANIHPETRVGDLSEKQLIKLHKELLAVLRLAIREGGSSDKNYVDAKGKRGSYLTFAKVFRREGQTCARCGSVIEKSKVAGRGTHTCPVCQPRPK